MPKTRIKVAYIKFDFVWSMWYAEVTLDNGAHITVCHKTKRLAILELENTLNYCNYTH